MRILPRKAMAMLIVIGALAVSGCAQNGIVSYEDSSHPIADAAPGSTAGRVTRSDYLESNARMLGVTDPPEVPVIREIALEEQLTVHDECMTAAGWPPFALGSWDIPTDQESAFNLARYICIAQYPVAEDFLQPLTESQILFVRDYWISDMIPCLEDNGIAIPQPPSANVHLDNWNTFDSWWPSAELTQQGLSGEALNEIIEACPEMPPSAVLFQQ